MGRDSGDKIAKASLKGWESLMWGNEGDDVRASEGLSLLKHSF